MDQPAKVAIEMFGVPGGASCGPGGCGPEGCGPGISMEEMAEALKGIMAQMHGDRVEVRYVDLFSEEVTSYPHVLDLVMNKGVPLPVICINGTPKLAGGISLPIIEKELSALGV